MYDRRNSIEDFLNATAARQPAPGGGSVTALVGALAAAIGEMVLAYSVGKKGLEGHQEQFRSALQELHRARMLMLELMIEDQTAYEALTAARKLPPGAERESRLPAALLASIRTPESIAVTGLAVLEITRRLVDSANFYLLSDLAVCAELAMATVRCGIYNVRVNLSSLDDPEDRRRIESQLNPLLGRATVLVREVVPRIWTRVSSGK